LGNEKWEGMKKGQHEVSVGKKGNQKIGQRYVISATEKGRIGN